MWDFYVKFKGITFGKEKHKETTKGKLLEQDKGKGEYSKSRKILHLVFFLNPLKSIIKSVLQSDGVAYLVLCNDDYSHKLAKAFAEDINILFGEELKRQYGTDNMEYSS